MLTSIDVICQLLFEEYLQATKYPFVSWSVGKFRIFSRTVLVSSNSICHPLGSIYCVFAVFRQSFGYSFAKGVKLFHHFLPKQLR